MHLKNILVSSCVTTAVMATLTAQAQIFKADNSDALNVGTSWVNGVAPASSDTAAWDSTVTAANCTNTLGGAVVWGGILVSNPPASVKITTNGLANATGISVGASGIAVTNSANLWVAPALTTTADQTWSVGSGRVLTLGEVSRVVTVANNVTINGAVAFPYQINDYGSLTIPAGSSLTCAIVAAAQSINVGTASGAGTVNQTGGSVVVGRTGSGSGSPSTSLIAAFGGTYNISGGTLTDNSATSGGRFDIGTGSGAGTVNISGSGAVQCQALYIANGGQGTVNVTNGSLTVLNNFRVGVNSSGSLNVYNGTVSSPSTANVPNTSGTGALNVNGGAVNLSGLSLSLGTGIGTVTVTGGVLTVTNNISLPNVGNAGTLNLNGGVTIAGAVTHPGAGTGTLVLDSGTLAARASSGTFIASGVTANVMAGGAILDTTNFSVTVLCPLLNGTGGADGGLTKFGTGTLTLGGPAGTYTGATRVNAGTLALTTTNHTGGSITVSNNAGLQVTLANAATMNCSSLALGTLGASLHGTNALTFNLGTGNPAVPVINAASLAATGAVSVTVNASSLALGTIHLIQYSGSIGGSDYVFGLSFLSGAVGYVTNNTATHNVDLVITGLPQLVWRAQVNSNWDISTTANWVDLSSGLPSTYPDGAGVLFNDSTSNAVVNLTNTASPAFVSLNNVNSNYVFGGGGRISGATGLTKTGAGKVTMALTNNYNGETVISNGTFVLGAGNAIPGGTGRGNVTLEGKLDMAGYSDAINGLSGVAGIVDNSSVNPVSLSVGGGGGAGVFSGRITNSAGSLSLTISGGSQQLLSRNGYTGSTTNSGALQLAYEQSISPAPLTLRAGSLYWVDALDHVLTNQVTLTGSSAFGAATNGTTTFTKVANITVGLGLTCNSDVRFAQGVTNGPAAGMTGKSGPGTLTLNNAVGDWSTGTFQANDGAVIFNGGTIIEDGNNFRIQCNAANGLALVVITNGASITLSNSSGANFRVGDSGDVAGSTNQVDIAGTLTLIPQTPNSGNRFQLDGANSAMDIANLLPGGVLNTRQVAQPSLVPGEFNFDGGILRAITNDLGPTFMQGIASANVLSRGAIIDDGGFNNITIGQVLAAGAGSLGGLTKQGTGTLTLMAQNTYVGDTLINAGTLALGAVVFPPSSGSVANSSNIIVAANAVFDVSAVGGFHLFSGQTLRGNGAVAGALTVDDGAAIAPGASIGTLTLSNAPTLNGALTMEIGKSGATPVSDELIIAGSDTLTYGGTLTVVNTGAALAANDTFKLFDAAAYGGAFTATNLPGGGVTWDLGGLYVNGTIRVASAPAPLKFGSVKLVGTNLVMTGSGGSLSGNYYLLGSTNVALSLSNWTRIATNHFDSGGNFNITNAVSPSVPRRFFDIQLP